jgi:hypothetical protein
MRALRNRLTYSCTKVDARNVLSFAGCTCAKRPTASEELRILPRRDNRFRSAERVAGLRRRPANARRPRPLNCPTRSVLSVLPGRPRAQDRTEQAAEVQRSRHQATTTGRRPSVPKKAMRTLLQGPTCCYLAAVVFAAHITQSIVGSAAVC